MCVVRCRTPTENRVRHSLDIYKAWTEKCWSNLCVFVYGVKQVNTQAKTHCECARTHEDGWLGIIYKAQVVTTNNKHFESLHPGMENMPHIIHIALAMNRFYIYRSVVIDFIPVEFSLDLHRWQSSMYKNIPYATPWTFRRSIAKAILYGGKCQMVWQKNIKPAEKKISLYFLGCCISKISIGKIIWHKSLVIDCKHWKSCHLDTRECIFQEIHFARR